MVACNCRQSAVARHRSEVVIAPVFFDLPFRYGIHLEVFLVGRCWYLRDWLWRGCGSPGLMPHFHDETIYGGFFGSGLGVILTAVLSITEPPDIRAIKALKNLLATSVAFAATVIFMVQGAVRWPETTAMLLGAMIGGYTGGHLILVLPSNYVRRLVILAGAVMTVIYAWRYWL